jgi:hypothetical protein
MRIYDDQSKRVRTSVTLFLSPDEASELADRARALADDPRQHHSHLNDATYEREITVAVYTRDNFAQFDAESRAVIGDP